MVSEEKEKTNETPEAESSQATQTLRENKMGTAPVPGLLIKMALPIIISMLVNALYNIVDSIFVAQLNENALTAVSLAFPYQTIMIGISIGTSVGINALVSRHLGEKDPDMANITARHGIFLAICSYIALAVFSFFFVDTFVSLQTVGADPQIHEYCVTYLNIVTLGSLGMFLQNAFEKLMNSTGKTSYTMISQIAGAVFNIIMDPLMIFGLAGFPAMGVAGAAIATIGGQYLGFVISLILNLKKNTELNLSMLHFRPKKKIILEIYRIALPSIVLQCIGSVQQVMLNRLLVSYTSTAVAVFGITHKLNSFIFFPVFGLNNAVVPVVAYNYGARHRKRIKSAILTGEIFAVSVMTLGMLAFMLLPEQLMLLFNASEDMLLIGIPAFRIIGPVFPLAGYSIVLGSVLQATGDAIYSMINSFTRQLVILLPAAYVLSYLGGLGAIWWAFIIAEGVSLCLMTFFFLRVYRKKIAPLPE